MAKASQAKPILVHLKRTKHILEAIVASRTEKGREYVLRFLLRTNMLCTCDGSVMQDSKCAHLRAALEAMDAEELRDFIMDAQVTPE